MSEFPILSINDARRFGVCRVCRNEAVGIRTEDYIISFVYDFGRQFAHSTCLVRAGMGDSIDRCHTCHEEPGCLIGNDGGRYCWECIACHKHQ